MKLKPLGDRVLVKIEQAEEKTKGGIYIPQTAQEKTQRGVVVAVGEGRTLDNGEKVPVPVKEGDKIIYDKYAGTQIKINEEEHLILSSDDILAIIEE